MIKPVIPQGCSKLFSILNIPTKYIIDCTVEDFTHIKIKSYDIP